MIVPKQAFGKQRRASTAPDEFGRFQRPLSRAAGRWEWALARCQLL
jgi:hypothetical protein